MATSGASSVDAPPPLQVAAFSRSARAPLPPHEQQRSSAPDMRSYEPPRSNRLIAPNTFKHTQDARARASSATDAYGDDSAMSALDDDEQATTSEAPKKVRKRTYYRRKEEMAVLLEELRSLEARAAFFHEREELAEQWKRIRHQQRANRSLRHAIRSQRLVFANARSMMSQFMQQAHNAQAYESHIKLGRDPVHRRAALLALKCEKLDDAAAFLVAHARGLDHSKSFIDVQRFESAPGDYCSVRFDVTPFEGLASARQVFDAYMSFSVNMEINVSATLGDITIREDDEIWGHDGVSHHRMVSTLTDTAVQLELNGAIFSEFYPRGRNTHLHDRSSGYDNDSDGGSTAAPKATTTTDELGVVVFDFVEDDALYPYRPAERVRQDVTCLAMVTSFRRSAWSPSSRNRSLCNVSATVDDNDSELVVVLLRWSLLRVHHSDLYISDDVRERMRSSIEQVRDSIITTVRQAVYSTVPVQSVPLPHL